MLLYAYYFQDKKGDEQIIYAESREVAEEKFKKFFGHEAIKFIKRTSF